VNNTPSPSTLARTIDHTLLKPEATSGAIETLCAEAVAHGFYSVCVNSSRAAQARDLIAGTGVKLAVVTGFPLGAMCTAAKAHETALAVGDGADEIDTVLNVGYLVEGGSEEVLADLRAVIAAAAGCPVKVIFETCLLNEEQKRLACAISLEAGAAFVKTSTGFSSGGATVEDVRLMKACVGDRCEVKASGGIRDRKTALAMIAAGATRLGTSAGIAIVSATDAGSGAY